jgi:HAD superfamily hydrolase (TIGR01509 family)
MRSARAAITLVFFADGLLIGSWAARIPAVQRQAELTSGELGLALFAASLGALLAMPAAGRLSERIGSRPVTIAALLGGGVALLLTSVAGGLAGLAAALFVFGAGFGAVNVAANAQGLALERLGGRSILSSFHAAFSFGGLAGAGLGALAAAGGIDPAEHFGATAAAVGLAALVAGSRLLPPDFDDREPTPILVRPQRSLLVLGAAAFFTLLAEGAAADWSAVYLSDSLGAGAAAAALGYTVFSLAMATSRVFGDRLNGLLGPVALARGGGLLAASALAVALVSGSTVAALVGFAAMGVGLGVVVPVLFRAAGSTPGVSAGAGVAAVSTIGWMGFLAGPPAIGVTADAVGIRGALAIVVVAMLALAVLAGSAGPRRRPEFRGLLFEPRAVLSDMDGVLVDSWTAIETTWRRFAQRHGLDPDIVLAASHGRPTVDVIRAVAPHLDAPAEAGAIDREQIAGVDGLRALPGARELVESVPAGRFAIVTSASRPLAESRLRAAGLPVPDVLVTADEVENGKPDPAGYLRAACLLGVDPAHSVVLEDAPAGVEAGVAAGMTVIGVLTTNSESALRSAHSRVPDLSALLPQARPRNVLPDDYPRRRGGSSDPSRRSGRRGPRRGSRDV